MTKEEFDILLLQKDEIEDKLDAMTLRAEQVVKERFRSIRYIKITGFKDGMVHFTGMVGCGCHPEDTSDSFPTDYLFE